VINHRLLARTFDHDDATVDAGGEEDVRVVGVLSRKGGWMGGILGDGGLAGASCVMSF
jgi:hypothetical protein